MLAVTLVFGSFLLIGFLLVGVICGWENTQVHPEMFDQNGNLVPDEIVAFRFENNYDNDEEDDD